MSDYFSKLDEVDKWLFDSFGILPGACNSIENLRHTTARMVAEALWPKKDLALTWIDIRNILSIAREVEDEDDSCLLLKSELCDEILRRFNEQRKK